MNPLSLIPEWVKLAAMAVLLAAVGVQTVRLASEKQDFADARADWADVRAEASRIKAKAQSVEREEENRRQQEKENAILEAKAKNERLAADLVRANRAAAGLQNAAAAAAERARQACQGPQAGAGGPAAEDPAGVLADVLGRLDARAGILAKAADDSRIAGAACERSYDSLTP